MTRWDVCNHWLATFQPPRRFLEIGVGSGRAAKHVRADRIIGVDPKPRTKGKGYTQLYQMPSDEFFATGLVQSRFHVVLVDGLHHSEQALRDIDNALWALDPRGAVVVHDCNPQDEKSQRVPRPEGQVHWTGDVWKAIVRLRATRMDLDVMTIDADEGLGIVRFVQGQKLEPLISVPYTLTWEGLQKHRSEWLGMAELRITP